jgi:hypothetical protein
LVLATAAIPAAQVNSKSSKTLAQNFWMHSCKTQLYSFLGRYGANAVGTLKNIPITPGFVSPNMHVQAETRNADTFPNGGMEKE